MAMNNASKLEETTGKSQSFFLMLGSIDFLPPPVRNYLTLTNGQYRGDDDMGRLMEDFSCTSAVDMNYTELAKRVRYLKENKDGENTMMSRAVEEFGRKCEEKGRTEGADRLGRLMTALKESGRVDDAFKAAEDSSYREKLFKELGIA